MIQIKSAMSSFSVNDLQKAKEFYTRVLGLEVVEEPMGLKVHLPAGGQVFIYHKPAHRPAIYTVLNFEVPSIDQTVGELGKLGVTFDRYDGMEYDGQGIMRGKKSHMGPDIAWFKDPAGNILSVLEQ